MRNILGRRYWRLSLVSIAVAFLPAGLLSCSKSDTPTGVKPPESSSISGTIHFTGAWPSTGVVRVSLFDALDASGLPTGAPLKSSNSISPATDFNFTLGKIAPGTYGGLFVEWVDDAGYFPTRIMGAYWAFSDSLCLDDSGLPKDPGPAPIHVTAAIVTANIDFVADCSFNGAAVDHVYNWAGTGQAGYGALGLKPLDTQLYWPQDVTVAPDGTPYVLDWNNHRVIALVNGKFKLIVGVTGGDFGDPCEGYAVCENVDALNAKLNHPTSVAFDPATGDMLLAAWHNSEIFRVDLSSELMDLICGDGSRGYNGDEQPAVDAHTDLPVSVAFDPQGRICFADQANMCVRQIDENGVIHTIAGTPPVWNVALNRWDRQPGFEGDGGLATSSKLFFEAGQVADPSGRICFGGNGNMYIADSQNHCIRVVDSNGIINRFAGSGPTAPGYAGDGGDALFAMLREPRDVAVDADGNVYIADTGNHVIRKVDTSGIITTAVGTYRTGGASVPPISPSQVRAEHGAAAAAATLTAPYGVEFDANGHLLVSDTGNHVIRIYYPN
jgi:sugar lactone lactonase YvrE